jgi:nucleoside-diphosphate-sugar epimerase
MRVLLTGASSFSGYWFATKLRESGFDVVAPLRAEPVTYTGIRRKRVERLTAVAEVVDGCSFGDPKFMQVITRQGFDALCHHAAQVANYRSPEFDIAHALSQNLNNIRAVLERMQENGLRAVIYTGTVFEANEGLGDFPMRAFSPYGLSKGLTFEVIRHWCFHYGLPLGKFVIANPFGPLEEPRFCAYLIREWRSGLIADVQTPDYVRDNIHIDLLALTYARFVRRVTDSGISDKFGPMGYVGTQGVFAEKFADAMRTRLRWDCRFRLLKQREFPEPLVRINTHAIDAAALEWSESDAWNILADYYRRPIPDG